MKSAWRSCGILGYLLPLFIDLMMDNPEEDLAMPLYPVIKE